MSALIITKIDKANHFIVGTLIFCACDMFLTAAFSFAIVALIGLTKEFRDVIKRGTSFDFWDFFFTMLGAVPPLALILTK
jgi:hypothetical protein